MLPPSQKSLKKLSKFQVEVSIREESFLRFFISQLTRILDSFLRLLLSSFSLVKKHILNQWKFRDEDYFIDYDIEIGVSRTDTVIKGYISFSGTEENVFNTRTE